MTLIPRGPLNHVHSIRKQIIAERARKRRLTHEEK